MASLHHAKYGQGHIGPSGSSGGSSSALSSAAGNGSQPKPRVAFWGAVKSNKDEATVRFLLRKAASGDLTVQQEALLLAAQQRLAVQGKSAVPTTPTTPSSSDTTGDTAWGRAALQQKSARKKPTKGGKGGTKRPRSNQRGGAPRSVAVSHGSGMVSVSLTAGGRTVSEGGTGGPSAVGRKFAQGTKRRRQQGKGGVAASAGSKRTPSMQAKRGSGRPSGSKSPKTASAPSLPVEAKLTMSLGALLGGGK